MIAQDEKDEEYSEARTIDVQVNKVRLEQEGSIAALTYEETEALRDMGEKALAIERQILEARGRRHEASLLAINEEIEKADLLFRKQGLSDQEHLAQVERLRAEARGFAEARAVSVPLGASGLTVYSVERVIAKATRDGLDPGAQLSLW